MEGNLYRFCRRKVGANTQKQMTFCLCIWKITLFLYLLENTRTENSIKNHWNCSVRKRIESYPARGLDLYSYRTEADGKKLEVGKQRNDRGMNLCSNVEPCSLDLVLGNVGRREGQSVAPVNEICKEWNDSAKSTGRTISTKATDACGLSSQDCRESASSAYTSESTNHSSINQPGNICDISFGGLMRSPNSQERTRETANTVDSSPSEALSSSLDLSLSTPFSSRGYDETMGNVSSPSLIFEHVI